MLAQAAGGNSANSIKGYTRAVRRKIYFLFAMLILVIILMKEARKPENWMWMGFDRNVNADVSTIEVAGFDAKANPDDEFSNNLAAGSLPPAGDSNQTLQSASNKNQAEFWKQLWVSLETEDKTLLVELIQLTQKPLNERDVNWADFEPLADAIKNAKQVDARFPDNWESKIKPGLLAVAQGEDVTIGQQASIGKLFEILDPLILDDLDDYTSPSRKSDQPAWFRYWERVLDQEDITSAENVSPVQLIAQADAWRFKPIRMTGKLLSGRRKQAGIHGPLRRQGVWYEWWIGNAHGADEVWCIYTANKPDSLEITDSFTDFDLPIEATGYFYKVRSYIDAQSQGNHCPLVFANSLNVTQRANPIAEATWTPSMTTIGISVVVVMGIAFAIAMLIYRADRRQLPQPGGDYRKSIGQHLDSLGDDPDIKSLGEKLEELP